MSEPVQAFHLNTYSGTASDTMISAICTMHLHRFTSLESENITTYRQAYRRIMTDISSIARGTSRIANTQMMLIRTNYTLPLVNPDWSIGPVVFVKRICLRLFYDHERLRPYLIDAEDSQLKNISISSTGAEIWAESYWLRLPYAVKLGSRGSKVIDGGFRSELIFNVNINR